ncbi:MAG: glycosyltransferase family 2 protein [Verrucomicrobia bacterium]|jgi:glycosyltransferase involved in cell wall biosynthesis|nr:glycosyltransferase family 2 protein [Verrucomicrobiota bacterium]MBT7068566.1 glycosyltransferase family 2 protein [Verrucomicrobiota bacterium]MBT7699566.1 glycosyltransferase family 2 protein [Verrucomicrobiota bacterium]
MHNISVIIPLYNKEDEVERCLHSVTAQTLSPHEILVIDDGSSDSSAARADAIHDERLRLIRQSNQGVSAARNRGIAAATGEGVAFLDADDEWKPDFLKTVAGLSDRFPQAALYATGCSESVDTAGTQGHHHFEGLPEDPAGGLIPDFFACMRRYPPINSSNTLCRRAVFDEVGGFPEGEPLAEDWDMWTRIALRHPVAYHPRIEAVYHTGASNRAARDRAFSGEDTALLKTLQCALAEGHFPYTSRASVERFLARHLLEMAKHTIASGHRAAARRRIRQAWPLHGAKGQCARWWLKSFAPLQST